MTSIWPQMIFLKCYSSLSSYKDQWYYIIRVTRVLKYSASPDLWTKLDSWTDFWEMKNPQIGWCTVYKLLNNILQKRAENYTSEVEVPMCASLGYNKTAVSISPFNLHSQKEAGMEIYSQGLENKKLGSIEFRQI